MLAMLQERPDANPDASSDYPNSISGAVIRCVWDGEEAVAVGADRTVDTKVGALLDLIELRSERARGRQARHSMEENVTLVLGHVDDDTHREAVDALATLRAAYIGPGRIRLVIEDEAGDLIDWEAGPTDFSQSESAAKWLELMSAVDGGPPELVTDLLTRVGHPALRAYPMLSQWPMWSLRLEGLIVGKIDAVKGVLDVGKPGSARGGSRQRVAWQATHGVAEPIAVSADTLDEAAEVLRTFAEAWTGATDEGIPEIQDEHALESRILRGDAAVRIEDGGRVLELIREDRVVNWGSQFPTKWGDSASNVRHYLDALLRDSATPWALELKVDGPGAIGRYYRHGIAQAVLYRHFIRTATPLHPWFARQNPPLDPTLCKAALVVPRFFDKQEKWRHRHSELARLFDVELIEVDRSAAYVRTNVVSTSAVDPSLPDDDLDIDLSAPAA